MDQQLNDRLTAIEQKVTSIHESVEKTRKYFLWTLVITIVMFILPLIGLLFAIPAFLSMISEVSSIGY